MSTTETSETQVLDRPRLMGGPPAADKQLEYFTSEKVIAEILHKCQLLTDDEFNDLVDVIGIRMMRLVLRAKVAQGDIRAADLYHRIVKEDRSERRERGKPAMRTVHTKGFIQDGRTTTTPIVDPTTKVVNETSE